ncbi:response regulator transcription factor [Clostridium ganghwense]|uniref:Stage 0 sporulation protein A homolog n=1 Tax=Clostridium ganghwense TaxID=312089 RepID=A0ABT4CQ93_9CLOT|nr:response regulator transcription factor [Clostridium ganghwense]MCY6371202.1 response regulator transcription factor [Clostridium ganghwense]
MFKILIVEDDNKIREALDEHLNKWGYDVLCVEDEKLDDILNIFISYQPHIILLDINLNAFDGFYWCRKIREISKVPIIFISSRNTNMDMIMAMNMGGDDFVQKPFSIDVLVAKIQAMIRRTYDYKKDDSTIIEYKGVLLDLNNHSVQYKNKSAELTKNELRILHTLMKHQGKIISQHFMVRQLWKDDEFVNNNAITVNMSRLRNKLKEIGLNDFIQTKIGQGYVIL